MSLKKTRPSRAAKGKLTTREALDREWKRLVKLRQRNDRLEVEMQAFEQACDDIIGEAERQLTRAMAQQTRHLSHFLTRKSLAQWQRMELMDWLHENVEQLSLNPFCEPQEMQALMAHLEALDKQLRPDQWDDPDAFDEEEGEERKDEVDIEDLFAEFEEEMRRAQQEESDDFAGDHRQNSSADEDGFETPHEESERERRQQQQSLQALLKSSSVNTLFRQLARRLHPDREQDPDIRQQRSEQMTQLLAARDNNDLFTLFAMYEAHVGESPMASLGDDEKVLKLMKSQTRALQEARDAIYHRHPLRSRLYERFYDRSEKVWQKRLREHRDMVLEGTSDHHAITAAITSLQRLKPYLQQRSEREEILRIAGHTIVIRRNGR